MSKFLIIGGGISGLVAARRLEKDGIDWMGLEKSDKLGGRLMASVPRLYRDEHRARIEELFPGAQWELVEDEAIEAKKGEWSTQDVELEPWEAYFSQKRFYRPSVATENWLPASVEESVRSRYQLGKTVGRISLEEKKVYSTDGTEWPFENLLWCAPIADFFKLCPSAPSADWKIPKNRRELGCVVVEMAFDRPFTTNKNSLGISFRFGDGKARATGNPLMSTDGKQTVFWTLYLDETLTENKEEVAHCLRNFRRELFRQFPDFQDLVTGERIVYLPRLALDRPLDGKSLELAPNVHYLGAEVRLKNTPEDMEHLDLLVENTSVLFESAPWTESTKS